MNYYRQAWITLAHEDRNVTCFEAGSTRASVKWGGLKVTTRSRRGVAMTSFGDAWRPPTSWQTPCDSNSWPRHCALHTPSSCIVCYDLWRCSDITHQSVTPMSTSWRPNARTPLVRFAVDLLRHVRRQWALSCLIGRAHMWWATTLRPHNGPIAQP